MPLTPEQEAKLDAAIAKKGKKPKEGEVLPPARPWDASEAGSLDRWVNALLDNGCNVESAVVATGCPKETAMEIMADPRYGARFNEIMGLRVKLSVAAEAGEYVKTAYGGKVLTEVFKVQSADESASQQARALKAGGRAARSRALIDIIKEAARQYEVLNGGHSPLPDEVAAIVQTVTNQEKANAA